VSLVARHLESHGIPTVVVGAARDIVEECGVARFLFSDLPLGNPCGHPWNSGMQQRIVGMALDLLESAVAPRTTVQTPFRWGDDDAWKDAFARVDPEHLEAIRRAGEERREAQRRAKAGGDAA